jgi:hypothetical protein
LLLRSQLHGGAMTVWRAVKALRGGAATVGERSKLRGPPWPPPLLLGGPAGSQQNETPPCPVAQAQALPGRESSRSRSPLPRIPTMMQNDASCCTHTALRRPIAAATATNQCPKNGLFAGHFGTFSIRPATPEIPNKPSERPRYGSAQAGGSMSRPVPVIHLRMSHWRPTRASTV